MKLKKPKSPGSLAIFSISFFPLILSSGCDLMALDLPGMDTLTPIERTETMLLTHTSEATDWMFPSETPEPDTTLIAFEYALQPGTPAYIENFAHPDAGCDWLGVAGQVFDQHGSPVVNLVVRVSGMLGDREVDEVSVTGIPEARFYGPGAFEIQLGSMAAETADMFRIQIFNLEGEPVSEAISFDTYENCQKNLVLINFSQNIENAN